MQGEDARLIDWATQQDQVWEWVTSDARRHGCSARDSALEWAKAASGDHSWWEAAGSLAVALVNSEEQRAPLNDYFEAVISLMEDPDFPLWLRAALALKEYDLATFWFPLEFSTWSDDATEYARIHRLVERYHAANVMTWDQYPWPGYIDIPESEIANDNTLPFRWSMAFDDQFPIGETQIEWCREMLHKPTCRGRTLGIVLRKLMDSGELRVEDLNSLAPQWRSRFLRNIAEEKYTFLPAVAVFGIALANFEIPGREKLFDHIRAQRHKPHIEDTVYSPLSGWYGTTEEITEVWERAIGSEWVPMAVRLGACMGKSHISGISFEEACDQAFRESGGNTDFVELAGCFSPSYERHLWHGLSMRSTELHRRIEAIARLEHLSPGFRKAAARIIRWYLPPEIVGISWNEDGASIICEVTPFHPPGPDFTAESLFYRWDYNSGTLTAITTDRERSKIKYSTRGKPFEHPFEPQGWAISAAGTPDGTRAIVSYDLGVVDFYGNEKLLHEINTPEGAYATSISPSGKYAVLGCDNGSLGVYDFDSAELIHHLPWHIDAINVALWGPTDLVATASRNGQLRIWDPQTGKLVGYQLDFTPPSRSTHYISREPG